jgi:two-component system NtrC family sensor kinase
MTTDENNTRLNKQEDPVKKSILTNMIFVPFVPFVLAILVSFYYFTTALETATTGSLARIVEDHRDMIESFLMERKSDLEFIVNTLDFDRIDHQQAIDMIFEHLNNRSNAFVDLGLFDSRGVHVSYAGTYPLKGKNYHDEFWFKQVMQTGTYISDIFLGYRNVPHFVIAVRRGNGEGSWVLRATIDTLTFDRLVSRVRIGKTGEAYILNQEGISQTGRRSGNVQVMDKDPDGFDFSRPGNGIHTFIKKDARANKYLYATARLKSGQWLLVVRQEKKDAYHYLYSAVYLSLIIMVMGGAVIMVMAVYTTERILKRISRLGQEKKTLGNQLIHAAQLVEIGEMAAGFAHEINNPLQIIKGEHALITTLMEEMPGPLDAGKKEDLDEIFDSLDQIKLQVNRCAEITQAILRFGRKNETAVQEFTPEPLLKEILHMIEKKRQVNGIRLVQNISQDLPAFMGDPSQFQQVMLNLFNNAFDAIAERHGSSGGVLGIESLKDNDHHLVIKISDNGSGICPENMDKIFSPFFTTKPVGKGSGLGLSVCYGIIKSLGGTMAVTSDVNVGTCFVIRLPAVN